MAMATRAGATPLHHGLPDEIIIWEILVRLPPEPLVLRCRPVCRAWRRITSTREFLLAHHARQPSLPIVNGFDHAGRNFHNLLDRNKSNNHTILAFDHRPSAADADAQIQTVARLAYGLAVVASCDGLLVLSTVEMFAADSRFTVCNPTTHEHAPLRKASGSTLLGMYRHRPTGEYRLLLHRSKDIIWSITNLLLPKERIGCHVLSLGSEDLPLRCIEGTEAMFMSSAAAQLKAPALLRDSLHWYQAGHGNPDELILVFDTIAESFRRMRPPPVVPSATTKRRIFETEGMLGIYGYDDDDATKFDINIWVLPNYEADEVWERRYRIKLPVAQMRRELGSCWDDDFRVKVVPVEGDDVLLLIRHDPWMFYVDTSGKLVKSFRHVSQQLYPSKHRLKQTLVPHPFLKELLGGSAASNSPFYYVFI